MVQTSLETREPAEYLDCIAAIPSADPLQAAIGVLGRPARRIESRVEAQRPFLSMEFCRTPGGLSPRHPHDGTRRRGGTQTDLKSPDVRIGSIGYRKARRARGTYA